MCLLGFLRVLWNQVLQSTSYCFHFKHRKTEAHKLFRHLFLPQFHFIFKIFIWFIPMKRIILNFIRFVTYTSSRYHSFPNEDPKIEEYTYFHLPTLSTTMQNHISLQYNCWQFFSDRLLLMLPSLSAFKISSSSFSKFYPQNSRKQVISREVNGFPCLQF